ncbi:hypothetical protein LTR91_003608 [Friedmanniomyces endolithicus]|uniref:Uncharacterized protein n=1 Tax=Friedmanniomyces endolithicus TaxID=329885 RepID=A0AAN6G0G2_9PEZI|nr:hypothetical protein LTR35_015730 [Friedmanniomyces endolithicus]KAK0293365.1 hypothetical protein LTS00_007611 [Friedmanniomyces endolithicus]KAK0302895.1 hypothetical protein LTR01_008450 [Friedmanniomyces endolithicus]KAK0325566.1 hypothetical protein LTR82_003101 [Friedmanniomyces endolithicus]KAK0829740.1 hypothetical protein LTR73_003875 [Friedmanniomyces endolithicus]
MHQMPMIGPSPPMYQPVNVTTMPPVGSQPQRVAPMMTQTIPLATTPATPQNMSKKMRPWLPEKGSLRVSAMCTVVYVLSTLAGGYLTYLSSGPFPAPWKDEDSVPFWPYGYLSILLALIIGGSSIYLMVYLDHLLGSERATEPVIVISSLTVLAGLFHLFISLGYKINHQKDVKRSPYPSFWMLFLTLWAFVYVGICLMYVRPLEKAARKEVEEARKASAPGMAQSTQQSSV